MGQFYLGDSQSRIYPHMRGKFGRGPTVVSKKGGGGVMIMKLLQVCQVQYCQQCVNFYYVGYNTANNVSNCGGDPVTQLSVNVYQMFNL